MRLIRPRLLLFFVFLLISGVFNLHGQISQGGLPVSSIYNLGYGSLPEISLELTASQTNEKNALLGFYEPGQALFAGLAVAAPLSPAKDGKWEVVNGNIHLWRLVIHVPGALGLGLNFDAFELSEGARLFVYNPEKSLVLGAFDHNNNNEYQIFSTQVIPGETLIIEYQEPYYPGKAQRNEFGLLQLESVIYLSDGGGLGLFEGEKGLGDSGPCQVNINCTEGNNWQDQKRGVARMLMREGSSYFWCTGSLMNNTARDAAPLFLSAEHCGANATERDLIYWQFYFNFERPACNNLGTPPQHLIVGADLLSRGPIANGSDFQLLMLRQEPPAYWRLFYNGWDRTNNTSNSGVGIHHPKGDVKKISTYTTQLTTVNVMIGSQPMASNSTWRVYWSATANGHGITEGGSSGSPLFNANGQVVGTLSGGQGSTTNPCSTPFAADYYGKIWYHWDKNGPNAEQRLAPFLDPLNTGQTTLNGFDPYRETFPAPGYISAKLNQDQNAVIEWFQPGSFPNPSGWYGYASTATHISPSTPERAVFFEVPYFELSYPVTISKVSHRFVEGSTIWTNNKFSFKIYDSDGRTLLHESPLLTASKVSWTEYTLPQPLTFNNYFYVAVKPSSTNGTPTSGGQRVNYGQGYSLVGTADDWVVPNYFPNFAGSLSYLTQIFVEPNKSNPAVKINGNHMEELMAQWADSSLVANYDLEEINLPTVSGYKLFRNGGLIYIAPSNTMTYTDVGLAYGFYIYHVTATYPGGESAPSPKAYLLKAAPCGETISQFPYTQVFPNNFNSDCWLDYGNADWQLKSSLQVSGSTINPAQGDQFFSMQTSAGSKADQWLILPLINMSALAQPALRFMFNGIKQQTSPTLNVWVSKNGESFQKVWDSDMHPTFASGSSNLQWLSSTINLKQVGNQGNVRIAFQYAGEGAGFFALDKIELLNATTITYNVTVTVNPANSGTITGAGSYLSGQTVNLIATPNLGYVFSGWVQGSNVISTDPEYSFIMPGGNVNLTASFVSDPTSVPLSEQGKTAFEVYPNPARDFVRVRFNESMPAASVALYNAQAQLVAQYESGNIEPGFEQQINTTGLSRGMYFIQVRGVNSVRVLKIILSE